MSRPVVFVTVKWVFQETTNKECVLGHRVCWTPPGPDEAETGPQWAPAHLCGGPELRRQKSDSRAQEGMRPPPTRMFQPERQLCRLGNPELTGSGPSLPTLTTFRRGPCHGMEANHPLPVTWGPVGSDVRAGRGPRPTLLANSRRHPPPRLGLRHRDQCLPGPAPGQTLPCLGTKASDDILSPPTVALPCAHVRGALGLWPVTILLLANPINPPRPLSTQGTPGGPQGLPVSGRRKQDPPLSARRPGSCRAPEGVGPQGTWAEGSLLCLTRSESQPFTALGAAGLGEHRPSAHAPRGRL